MEKTFTLIATWPTVLTEQDAARYLSLDISHFRQVARELGVIPINLIDDSARWRKRDLDSMVSKLPYMTDYWAKSDAESPVRLDNQTIEAIAKAVRMEMGPSVEPHLLAKLVSIGDTIDLLGVGRTTVYRLIKEGALSKRKIGRRSLITRTSIERLQEREG